MLWCESVAPLGKPVVPLVYWMLIGSSNCSASARSRRASRRDLVRARDERRPSRASRGTRPARARGHDGRTSLDHRDVVRRLERARGDEHAAAGLVEHVRQLRRAVGGVDVDEDHAGPAPTRTARAPTRRSSAPRSPSGRRAPARPPSGRARRGRPRRPAPRRSSGSPGGARRAPRARRARRPSARGWRRSSRPAAGAPPSRSRTTAPRPPSAQSPDSYLNEIASRTRKRGDPAVLDREVLADHLGDAQVAHRLRGRLDRRAGGGLPGLRARADHLGDAIDAVGHGNSSSSGGRSPGTVPCARCPGQSWSSDR